MREKENPTENRREVLGCALKLAAVVTGVGVGGSLANQIISTERPVSPSTPIGTSPEKPTLTLELDPEKLRPGKELLRYFAEVLGPLDPENAKLVYEAINETILQIAGLEHKSAVQETKFNELKKLVNETIPKILTVLELQLQKKAEDGSTLIENLMTFVRAVRILTNPTDKEKKVITDALLYVFPGGKDLDALLAKWSQIEDENGMDVLDVLNKVVDQAPWSQNALLPIIGFLQALDDIGDTWQENRTNIIASVLAFTTKQLAIIILKQPLMLEKHNLEQLEATLKSLLALGLRSQEIESLIEKLQKMQELVNN